MKRRLLLLSLIVIFLVISGCAPDYEEDENEVFVEIGERKAIVEVKIGDAEWEFELDTVDLDTIINEISSRTGLSSEEINAIIEVEIVEESTVKPFEEDIQVEELLEEPIEVQITDIPEVDEVTGGNVPEEIIEENIQEEQPNEDKPDTSLHFRPEWGECEDKDVTFSVSPIDPEVIKFIEPMGKMHISHPFPTRHMYITDDKGVDDSDFTTYDVVSPADGYIANIGAMPRVNDYNIGIWHSCSVVSFFIHLGDLPPEIQAITGELPPGSQWEALNENAIFVKAGQRIGRSKGGFDFGVLDNKVVLTGFIIPEHNGGEPKIHTVDPFDYFEEPVRSQWLEKNLRTVEPFGGKIDYDIDGRLVGNWFEEGTEGYRSENPNFSKGHLAIAYNHINPTLVEVSFGAEDDIGISYEDCNVCSYSFAVKGNKPDPADVSVETGLVKYELLGEEHIDHPTLGIRVGVSTDEVLGVFLVQMLDDRTIKGEVFPRKKASQVNGFTSDAKIYER